MLTIFKKGVCDIFISFSIWFSSAIAKALLINVLPTELMCTEWWCNFAFKYRSVCVFFHRRYVLVFRSEVLYQNIQEEELVVLFHFHGEHYLDVLAVDVFEESFKLLFSTFPLQTCGQSI